MLAQLLSFPMGRLWAAVVPNVTIFGVHLNPGPFTIKEHVLLTIMATVGGQSAYAVRPLVRFFTNLIITSCQTDVLPCKESFTVKLSSLAVSVSTLPAITS